MRRIISAPTALILSFLLAGCGGRGTSSPIPSTPQVTPEENLSSQPLTQSSTAPFTKDQIRKIKGLFSASTVCPDGNVADYCVTLSPGQSYTFGLVVADPAIFIDGSCEGSEILTNYNPYNYAGITVAVPPANTYIVNAPVQPKNFTITAVPSTPYGINYSIDVNATFTKGIFDPSPPGPECLPGYDEMPAGFTDVHVILTAHGQPGTISSPSPSPSPPPPPCPPPATPGPNILKEVPVTDKNGHPILGARGIPLYRPDDGHDPQFYVNEANFDVALALGAGVEVGVGSGNPVVGSATVLASLADNMSNFGTGGKWDEQRVGGDGTNITDRNFIDYSSVVIGIWGAAAGIPEPMMQSAQQLYSILNNKTFEGTVSQAYPPLGDYNVNNVHLGYALYQGNLLPLCH